MRLRLQSVRLVAAVLLSLLHTDASAQTVDEAFVTELSRSLLGSKSLFQNVDEDRGWRGVALAPLGTTVEPLVQAYSGQPGGTFQLLANTEIFGRPVEISNGRVSFLPTSIADIWEGILVNSAPNRSLEKDRNLTNPVMRWLFQPIFSGNKRIGYNREPSRFVKRYREYEAQYSALSRAKDNGVWRLIPSLSKYDSYTEAERAIVEEWIKSGYKYEVESAYWTFQESRNPSQWSDWFIANEKYKLNLETIDFYQKLPITYLLPPPSSWPTVSAWRRAVHKVPEVGGEYRYQIARVVILRPWFQIEALLDEKIRLRENSQSLVVSVGEAPTFEKMKGGSLPGYVEELLLVRDIHFVGETAPTVGDHPLSVYAYPESINLLGYVVRVLPEVRGQDIVFEEDGENPDVQEVAQSEDN